MKSASQLPVRGTSLVLAPLLIALIACKGSPPAAVSDPVGIELRDPTVGTWRIAVLVTPEAPAARVAQQMTPVFSAALRRCVGRDAGVVVAAGGDPDIAIFSLDAVSGRLAHDAAHEPLQEFSRCLARSLNGVEVVVLRGAPRKVNVELMRVQPSAAPAPAPR